MTDKATMPEVIWASERPQDVGSRWTAAQCYPDQNQYSLAAVAEEMSNAAALICMGYSNLDGQVELERALTSYNALMKGDRP